MSGPRRRLFGPLLYSTLVVAFLVVVYSAVVYGPSILGGIVRSFDDSRETAALAETLRSGGPEVREHAASLLMSKGPEVWMPIFRKAARDPRGEVRALALHWMVEGRGEPSQVFRDLIAAADDGDELVRLEAAHGLGRQAGFLATWLGLRASGGGSGGQTAAQRDETVRTLRRLLGDSASRVRAEAAAALGEFGPDASTATDLVAAAGDTDRLVRLAVARSLLRINGPGDEAAARTLVAMVGDPQPVPDRMEALQIIRGLNDAVQDQAVAALANLVSRGDPAIIPDVLACLPSAGPRAKSAMPALEAMLDDPEPGLRAAAGMAIVAIEGGEDFQTLINSTSPGAGMPAMAAGGAGMAGAGGMMGMMPGGARTTPRATGIPASPRALAVLVRLLGDTGVTLELRASAVGIALAAAPTALARATPELVRQLADPDPKVRRSALDLLNMIIDVTPVELPSSAAAK